ncbi:MAG: hypothetical protein JST04_02375 [Bdellovibrionales bacterium]|nr:hypothetical protein [Bdellovibrionales bacterium]
MHLGAGCLTLATIVGTIPSARAWYDHTSVMDRVQKRLEAEFPEPGPGNTWNGRLPLEANAPINRYYDVASLLLLQPRAAENLPSKDARTLHDLLRLGAEDPDHGIDIDLPDSADPSDDRRYMGGTKGPSSAGFRHMFWSGWDWRKPFRTFQIPARALGQAPDRIELLANEARDRFRKGDVIWGGRILGWTIHYLQDLTQPFHAVEFPTFEMVPLRALLAWPPTEALDRLIRESTRVVTNYHWAYEGYVRHALLAGDASPFKECFEKSGGTLFVNSPRDLALEIANRSIERAHETGEALVAFVGHHLKEPAVSVPLNPKQIPVEELLKSPEKTAERDRLNKITCESLRLTTDATIWITRWVFAK